MHSRWRASRPPPLIPSAARTQSTKAVLDYFAAANEGERTEAFNHLVRICVVAVRPLYAPADDDDGVVDAPSTRTREWIELWVLKFLAPYRGKSHEELIAAADNDEFRYVGRQCRLDLLNVIRDAVKRRRPRPISLATPVEMNRRDSKPIKNGISALWRKKLIDGSPIEGGFTLTTKGFDEAVKLIEKKRK